MQVNRPLECRTNFTCAYCARRSGTFKAPFQWARAEMDKGGVPRPDSLSASTAPVFWKYESAMTSQFAPLAAAQGPMWPFAPPLRR